MHAPTTLQLFNTNPKQKKQQQAGTVKACLSSYLLMPNGRPIVLPTPCISIISTSYLIMRHQTMAAWVEHFAQQTHDINPDQFCLVCCLLGFNNTKPHRQQFNTHVVVQTNPLQNYLPSRCKPRQCSACTLKMPCVYTPCLLRAHALVSDRNA